MVQLNKVLLPVVALALMSHPVSAEWKYDEKALKNCLCYYSCGELGGWDCASVWCGYDPKPSDSSPACRDISGGPCRCEGFGCGRTQIITSGRNYEYCMRKYAPPVCGDNYCDTDKNENCRNCARDCGCGGHAVCAANISADKQGCIDKCAGIQCKPRCDGDTLMYAGECDRDKIGCVYKTVKCKNGCDNSSWGGARCKPEEDKCKGVVCDGECGWGGVKWDGVCNQSSGQCVYSKNATCPAGCADNKKCRGVVSGTMFYTETMYKPEGERVPMRNIKLWFEYTDKDGTLHTGKSLNDPEYTTWTDNNGGFTWKYFDDFDPDGKLSIAPIFDNRDGKVYIAHSSDPDKPYGLYYAKDIPVTDPKLKRYEMDLTETPLAANALILKAVGKLYHWTLKAVEYKENNFRKGDTVKERVKIGRASGSAWHLSEAYSDTNPDDVGMDIPDTDISFNNPEAPCNREFHEYGHHIQDEYLKDKRRPAGEDHGGYTVNPDSEYGMIEGWAEFCSLAMKKANGLGSNGDYELTGTVLNLELNYDIATRGVHNDEELAVAGILWDLIDYGGDYSGGLDDDKVSISPFEVYNAFMSKRDFGDGQGVRPVRTIYDLYVVLNGSGDKRLLEKYPGDAKMTKLDHIFISHGVFQDRNNNSVWDFGEEIGYNGIGNNTRKDIEPEPGTEIIVDVKDHRGKTIPNLYVRMDVNYSDPYRHLSGPRIVLVEGGRVYVPLPPRNVNATIKFTAFQGGTNNTGEATLTFTTGEMYRRLDPKKPLATLKTTIKTSPVPCTSDLQCMRWFAGDRCDNKTRTCVGRAGPEEPVSTDCTGPAVCVGEKDSVFSNLDAGEIIPKNIPCCNLLGLLPIAFSCTALKVLVRL